MVVTVGTGANCGPKQAMSRVTIGGQWWELTPQCKPMNDYTSEVEAHRVGRPTQGPPKYECGANEYLNGIRKENGDGWTYSIECTPLVPNPMLSTVSPGTYWVKPSNENGTNIGVGNGQYTQCNGADLPVGMEVYDDGYLALQYKCVNTGLRQNESSLISSLSSSSQ
jgi:hypothetical protein